MAQKRVVIPRIGEVVLAKRRGSKSLRLSIAPSGQVRVGMPHWMPYSAGISFAKKRADWINLHLASHEEQPVLDGSRIGKSHRVHFFSSNADFRSKISGLNISIYTNKATTDPWLQKRLRPACERALKKEASVLLPQRVRQLAGEHGFEYKSLKIKRLTSRWGSCSARKEISLSFFLIQLPWEYIDFVILHELAHTKYLDHSRDFWQQMDSMVLSAKAKRKKLKDYKPRLEPS